MPVAGVTLVCASSSMPRSQVNVARSASGILLSSQVIPRGDSLHIPPVELNDLEQPNGSWLMDSVDAAYVF